MGFKVTIPELSDTSFPDFFLGFNYRNRTYGIKDFETIVKIFIPFFFNLICSLRWHTNCILSLKYPFERRSFWFLDIWVEENWFLQIRFEIIKKTIFFYQKFQISNFQIGITFCGYGLLGIWKVVSGLPWGVNHWMLTECWKSIPQKKIFAVDARFTM